MLILIPSDSLVWTSPVPVDLVGQAATYIPKMVIINYDLHVKGKF